MLLMPGANQGSLLHPCDDDVFCQETGLDTSAGKTAILNLANKSKSAGRKAESINRQNSGDEQTT